MTEPYKFVCVHVLEGAQPTLDRDGDALCVPCRKRGWLASEPDVALVPFGVYDSVVNCWGVQMRV